MVHGRNRHAAHGQCPGQPLPEVHALQHVLGGRVQVADDLGHPAVDADLVWLAGMPDVHGPEMRTGRVLEPDAVDDGHVALVIDGLELLGVGPEGQIIVDGQHLVFGDVDLGPVVPIQGIGVRHDGVQVIVGAGELEYDQHRVFLS